MSSPNADNKTKKRMVDSIETETTVDLSYVRELEEKLRRQNNALIELEEEFQRKDRVLRDVLILNTRLAFVEWKELPESLQNDSTVLMQFLLAGYQGDLHVSYKRSDFSENTIREVLPRVLVHHRHVAVDALNEGLFQWDEIKPTLEECQNYERLSIEALKRGLVDTLLDIPRLGDVAVADLLKLGELEWGCLPADTRNGEKFCRLLVDPMPSSLRDSDYSTCIKIAGEFYLWYRAHKIQYVIPLVKHVFQLHHRLEKDDTVWEKIFKHYSATYRRTAQVFWEAGSDLFEKACQRQPRLLGEIDQVLAADTIKQLVVDDVGKIFRLESPFIAAFPDFFVEQLSLVRPSLDNLDHDVANILVKAIPRTMWTNGESDEESILSQTWFDAGLPMVFSYHPTAWFSDREKLLRLAEKAAKIFWKVEAFQHAPEGLMNDVNFVKEAMAFQPVILTCASERLLKDFELVMWACRDLRYTYATLGRLDFSVEPEETCMLCLAREKCLLQKVFINPFLCAVFSDRQKLGLGILQNTDILKTIAAFAGIPKTRHFENIQHCLAVVAEIEAEGGRVTHHCT